MNRAPLRWTTMPLPTRLAAAACAVLALAACHSSTQDAWQQRWDAMTPAQQADVCVTLGSGQVSDRLIEAVVAEKNIDVDAMYKFLAKHC